MPTPIKQKPDSNKGALARIADIEETIPAIIQALQDGLNQMNAKLNGAVEVLKAVTQELGTDKIQAIVDAARATERQERADAAKKWLDEAVAEGKLKHVDTITDDALVVGVEYDKDGVEIPPGRVQLTVTQIQPVIREKLVGQPVGTRVETPAGTTFEILEAYLEVPAVVPPEGEVVNG